VFHVPQKLRLTNYSSESDGNNGAFAVVRARPRDSLFIIASDGGGWEHVSVSKKYDCPTWADMCEVKALFWDPEDLILQYHPPRSQYVNLHPHCLHLWRPIGVEIPLPPKWMIGN
jgi:hypothetical protein